MLDGWLSSARGNVVRLIYLDEAGTDASASHLCVAGVLVHGDGDWPKVDKRIADLIERFIPEPHRRDFIFHAKDIYHGSGYFDRRKPEWAAPASRNAVLDGLAAIIDDLNLPVVFGNYDKAKFGQNIGLPETVDKLKLELIQRTALVDCLVRADAWLERFAPSELATVIHEDGVPMKGLMKYTVSQLRDAEALSVDLSPQLMAESGLPLKRIIDTVHFAEKADARPLQLADFCAFHIGRILKGKPVASEPQRVLMKSTWWIREWIAQAEMQKAD